MTAVKRLVEPLGGRLSLPKILHARSHAVALDLPRHPRIASRSAPTGGGSAIPSAQDRAPPKTRNHAVGPGSSTYYQATARIEVATPPLAAGDDFAFLAQRVPAAFVLLGGGHVERGIVAPHHAPDFDLDEDALPRGAELLARVALRV